MYYQGIKKIIEQRQTSMKPVDFGDIHPVLARIFAARGVKSASELERGLAKLPSPWLLSGMDMMVHHLAIALHDQQRISIVGDYDADGATSCAVAVQGLRLLGAKYVDFVVPNRFEYGYGLTPEIVELVKQQSPDVIITVDNGIASFDGVRAAKALGIKVLVTDHHLPASELPAADAIVNPNLVDDKFPSKALAGVGVIFYVLLALRSHLREQHWFELKQLPEPNLAQLLDYVALGTVADVVSLNQINRILVYQGLSRLRSGQGHAGLNALIEVAGKNIHTLNAADLGFSIAPRLNAAGRMDDMSIGIQCLLTRDAAQARKIALQLHELNNDRREVEGQMKHEAMTLLDEEYLDAKRLPSGVCLYKEHWHQGVIGILASRIKERLHRPVIAFAPAGDGMIKGSARSIAGVHIRDALSDVATQHPNLLSKFGGHAMAAGLSLRLHDLAAFTVAFDEVISQRLAQIDLTQKMLSDGQLSEADMTVEFAELLQNAAVWGQDFPEPMFDGVFEVIQVRIVGQKHLKLVIRHVGGDTVLDAIAFFADKPEHWLGMRSCRLVYTLSINEYRGQRTVQLLVQYMEKLV